MKSLVLPYDRAQALFQAIAALPIPYTQSRPIIEILESGKVAEVQDTDSKAGTNGSHS
jgi:hypothetical protein